MSLLWFVIARFGKRDRGDLFTVLFKMNPLRPIKIGIDFDNTIVCYDAIFDSIAHEKGIVLSNNVSSKTSLRDSLRAKVNGELEWTKIQGEVYGPRILEAKPFKGVIEFLKDLRTREIPFCIISHKTRFPVLGAAYDLHEWAIQWLSDQNFLDPNEIALTEKEYFFEVTKEEKLQRIYLEGCTHFIDDLPEFLSEPGFSPHVQKIWFTPAGGTPEENTWIVSNSWEDLAKRIPEMENDSGRVKRIDSDFRKVANQSLEKTQSEFSVFEDLLQSSTGEKLIGMERLSGGANNRSFKLKTASEKVFFGKEYFISSYDRRDRLKHEYDFLNLLHSKGIRACPRPIGKQTEFRIAIYEYIDGKPLEANSTLPIEYWDRSLEFLMELQTLRQDRAAQELPVASEACFSLDDHLAKTRKRRDEWLALAKSRQAAPELCELVTQDLEDLYEELAEDIFSQKDFRKEIPIENRILSPSDFGFHNILIRNRDELVFVDFEYAGWDDPGKTIADFFFQPRFPAPQHLLEPFVMKMASLVEEHKKHDLLMRLPLVRRCVGLKWCYILLNDFHPEASKRRKFASNQKSDSKLLDKRILEIKTRVEQLRVGSFV
jgi:thiamine kinase-like enzyme